MVEHRILIIDDDLITAVAVEEYLANFGYETYHAKNGDEGLEMIGKIEPDLVLLDINMPGKDGFQTLAEIKNNPALSEIPVIFLSAYDRSNLKVKGLELGADDYITRPFEQAELLARIRAALRRTKRYIKEKNGRNGRTLEGDLSDMGLLELLQTIEMGKKTAVVKLINLGGELVLENGLLLFAGQGNSTGKDALDRILLAEKGEFSVTFNKIPANINRQPVPLMKAIMDSLTYVDEIKSMMKNLDPGLPVKIGREIKRLKGGENLRENTVFPLIKLIISLEGDLKESLQSLLKILEGHTLILETNS